MKHSDVSCPKNGPHLLVFEDLLMKVKRVHYENFRILRDLELEFSTDPERRLTVIRAENETGKTKPKLYM